MQNELNTKLFNRKRLGKDWEKIGLVMQKQHHSNRKKSKRLHTFKKRRNAKKQTSCDKLQQKKLLQHNNHRKNPEQRITGQARSLNACIPSKSEGMQKSRHLAESTQAQTNECVKS